MGIRGAFGIYRDVFTSIAQAETYEKNKIKTPVLALGAGLGEKVKTMLQDVVENVYGGVVPNCGHFIPDERPEYVLEKLEEFLVAIENKQNIKIQ